MIINFRKFACTFALLLSAANIPLYLHLSQEHSDHDDNKCPICQQTAINKTKAILPNHAGIIEFPKIFGDLVIDGKVDTNDLAELCYYWMCQGGERENDYYERADASKDGAVNFTDFAMLAGNWLLE